MAERLLKSFQFQHLTIACREQVFLIVRRHVFLLKVEFRTTQTSEDVLNVY